MIFLMLTAIICGRLTRHVGTIFHNWCLFSTSSRKKSYFGHTNLRRPRRSLDKWKAKLTKSTFQKHSSPIGCILLLYLCVIKKTALTKVRKDCYLMHSHKKANRLDIERPFTRIRANDFHVADDYAACDTRSAFRPNSTTSSQWTGN